MKVFAIVMMIMGAVIFWIGLWGSQHAVMAMIRGTTTIQPSGLPLNPSGPAVSNPQLAASRNQSPPSNQQVT